MLGDRPTARRQRGGHASGVGARQDVVARGGVGGGWALVGARPLDSLPHLPLLDTGA